MFRLKKEDGQAMVEFAVLVPVFLTVFCAIIEFGWVFMHELQVTNAAREGAREGIVCALDTNFNTKVKNRVLETVPNFDTSKMAISAAKPSAGDGNVVVEIDYSLKTLTPLGAIIFGSPYHVKGSCTMKSS